MRDQGVSMEPLPFTSFGARLGMVSLPQDYFPWLVAILVSYCLLTQSLKLWYVCSIYRQQGLYTSDIRRSLQQVIQQNKSTWSSTFNKLRETR
jgi:hypothetical protein